MKVSKSRAVATRVLFRVAEKGSYAAPTLDAELARQEVSGRDAALATEIVYGSLRVLPALDEAILQHVSRSKGDPWATAAMRVAAYQLLYLERVPPPCGGGRSGEHHPTRARPTGCGFRQRGPA